MKLAVISGFLGQLTDRFSKYHQPRSIGAKLDFLGEINGVAGVELIYPYDFADPTELQSALRRNGLKVAAVNLNLKNDPLWERGSLTVPDAGIRREAVRWLQEALDAAAGLDAPRITVAFLNDGHDYSFEADYQQAWEWMVEGLREAAGHRPDRVLSVEYKLSEPRVRTTVGDVAKGILLCQDVGLNNVGITLDMGHALYAGENPSESLALMRRFGVKPYIHLNDNYRNWDWDLLPGTVNFWDLLEFMVYLNEYGYDDWMTFDVFPARVDAAKAFGLAVRQMEKVRSLADRLDIETIRANIQKGDPVANWEQLFQLFK
jgi:xylose isomerase